jgi:hypothetical protein
LQSGLNLNTPDCTWRKILITTAPAVPPTHEPVIAAEFVDRRNNSKPAAGFERRQFGNSHAALSPDARELAEAIDHYKLANRRRYITYEEMLQIIHTLGYRKS